MKMTKHYSLKHSENVLKLVGKKLKTIEDVSGLQEVRVSCWSNGREQGFHLSRLSLNGNLSLCVNFAQQRNSDQTVVYYGNVLDFDITTHQPESEKIWHENHSYFNDDKDAADFIVRKLLGE